MFQRLGLFGAATAFALAFAPQAQAQQFINVLTGGTSGVYYPLGVALSEIYAAGIAGSRTQVQATRASVENLNLLAQGRGEIAFALGDAVQMAWAGNTEAGYQRPLTELRAIAAIYPNYIQIVADASTGATTLADLRGATMSVGAPSSGTELNARAIFAAAGMSYEDLGRVEYLPFAESGELIKNRQIQATLASAGLGVAFIRDLSATHEITLVSIPEEVVAAVGAPFVPAVIPANTYDGQTADVATAAIPNFLVTHAGVPDEVAYEMAKQMYENIDTLYAAHNAAKVIKRDNAIKGMPVPLHPGAAKYYKEVGLLK